METFIIIFNGCDTKEVKLCLLLLLRVVEYFVFRTVLIKKLFTKHRAEGI